MQGDEKNPKAPLADNFRPTLDLNQRSIRTNIDFRRKPVSTATSYKKKKLSTDPTKLRLVG